MDLLYNVQCTYTESPHKIRSAPLATALGALSSWSSYWSSDLTLRSYCIGLFGYSLLSYWSVGWVPIGHLGDRLSSYWSSDLSVGSYWSPFYTAYSLIGQVISPWVPIGPLGYSLSSYWSSVLSVGSYWPSWIYSLISYWLSDLSVGSYWPPRLYSLISYMYSTCTVGQVISQWAPIGLFVCSLSSYWSSSNLSMGSYWPAWLLLGFPLVSYGYLYICPLYI